MRYLFCIFIASLVTACISGNSSDSSNIGSNNGGYEAELEQDLLALREKWERDLYCLDPNNENYDAELERLNAEWEQDLQLLEDIWE